MIEHFFSCPYCWQRISVLLDLSEHELDTIEDCEVCCHPLRLQVQLTPDGNVGNFLVLSPH